MGIKGDSALSSFTPSELTESSAIHGDFDQASLNYSGHQNIEVRAEDEPCSHCGGGGVIEVECNYGHYHTEKCHKCGGANADPDMEYGAEDEAECDICGGTEEVGYVDDALSFKVCEYCDVDGPDYDPKLWEAEGLGKDSCCCGATKSKPCACMKTGAKCSGSCACSTKEAEFTVKRSIFGDRQRILDLPDRLAQAGGVDLADSPTEDLGSVVVLGQQRTYDKEEPHKAAGHVFHVGHTDDLGFTPAEIVGRPKETEYKRPTPKWAKPLGLIGGLAAGYISAQMIDNAKE
jgi:hypothetical protein